jgi:hypothetical protein
MPKYQKMKKIFLLLSIICFTQLAMAQCVPGTKTAPGKGYIIPDSATGMVHACAGLPYDETFYIKAFKDTTIILITGTTDSIIINVDPITIGLPSYLNVTTKPATLPANAIHNFPHISIKGDSLACIRIQGTVPTGTAAATTSLNIPFEAYLQLSILGLPTGDTSLAASYSSYKYIIDAPGTGVCAVNINQINRNLSAVQVVPNPAQELIYVNMVANQSEDVTVSITNAIGQTIANKQTLLNKGSNFIPFDLSSYTSGMYMYTIRNKQNAVVSGKFVKK